MNWLSQRIVNPSLFGASWFESRATHQFFGDMVKLVNIADLDSAAARFVSSSLTIPTTFIGTY